MFSTKLCYTFQATEVLSLLYAAHQEGKKNVGVDIEVNFLIFSSL